jgi:PPOX class probable F420-dependent enzyme
MTVLFGTDGDRILVHTGADSGKVKRIKNNGRVLVQPSNIFGKPIGKEYGASARVLPKYEKNSAKNCFSLLL